LCLLYVCGLCEVWWYGARCRQQTCQIYAYIHARTHYVCVHTMHACVYVYKCARAHLYTHTHACVLVRAHAYIYRYMHICIYIHTHKYIYMYTSAHIDRYIYKRAGAQTYMCVCTWACIYVQTHIQTHMRTHAYKHTRIFKIVSFSLFMFALP